MISVQSLPRIRFKTKFKFADTINTFSLPQTPKNVTQNATSVLSAMVGLNARFSNIFFFVQNLLYDSKVLTWKFMNHLQTQINAHICINQ